MASQYWSQEVLLHDHLDGSFPMLTVLPQLFRMCGKKYPFTEWRDHHGQVKKWFADLQIDIVKKFSITTGVMQTKEALILTAQNYVRVRARQGFKYCEATIAPQYHIFGGLTVVEVLGALIEGIKLGESEFPEIEVNLLPSVGREVSPNQAVELVELFSQSDRDYCPGVGLVCDEASHPPEKHIKMFKRATELGFKKDCHAGEWVNIYPNKPDLHRDLPGILKNIRTAIFYLEANRLGHAIGLAFDSGLMDIVAEKEIAITGCPGSNLTSGLISNLSLLRIDELLKNNIRYSLHPDDDLFMPDLNEVFMACDDVYRFDDNEKRLLKHHAWLARFGNRKVHKHD